MDKLIVVIGAGPGLGQAIAKRFGKEKYKVVLVARNEESLLKISDELNSQNIDASFKAIDVSDDEAFVRTIEEIKSQFGTPDVVIFNVGITSPDSTDLSVKEIIEHYRTDVAAAFSTIKEFADEKFAEKKGALILTGGGLALYPVDGFMPLSIDKAALRAMTYIFHNKFKSHGFFVGTVTICGTINGTDYFSADNIAEMYWQMNIKRDKCEYVYQFPELAPEKLYADRKVNYGIFENNTGEYWTKVYELMAADK